jgi:hypothetical protein
VTLAKPPSKEGQLAVRRGWLLALFVRPAAAVISPRKAITLAAVSTIPQAAKKIHPMSKMSA